MKYEKIQIDQFAEHLSEGKSPGEAVVAMGMDKRVHAAHMMNQVRHDLGWIGP